MKILVKGNIVALGGICDIVRRVEYDMQANYKVEDEKDFDLILSGNIEVESILLMGGAQVFATGCVVALGMTDEQIKAKKGE